MNTYVTTKIGIASMLARLCEKVSGSAWMVIQEQLAAILESYKEILFAGFGEVVACEEAVGEGATK